MDTIRSARDMDSVFRTGRRHSTGLVIVLCRESPEGRGPQGRVAFVAGKKLGNAVVRNRTKRVLRAAVRGVGGPWPGYDVVLMGRPSTAAGDPRKLEEALRSSLKALGVFR